MQPEVAGQLASGGSFRATSYTVELTDAAGNISATFDINDLRGVARNGQTVTLKRGGAGDVTITTATLDDAGKLEATVRAGLPVVVAAQTGGGLGRVFKWGCLSIVGLLVVALIIGVVASLSSNDKSSKPTTVSGNATSPSAVAQRTAPPATKAAVAAASTTTAAPTATVSMPATATAEQPTAAPTRAPSATPEAQGSGRSNPVPLGDVGATKDWEVQVLDVVRGADALARLQEANQFNDAPPDGFEYALASVRVKYLGNAAEAQSVDFSFFNSTGDARVRWGFQSVVEPDPELRADLFKDGEATGWVTVLARANEHNLMLIFEPFLSTDEGDELFMALDAGANVQPLADRLTAENDLGFDRADPVALGQHVVGDTWELWVIESVRGDDALQRVKDANQFNEDPAPGMEYVLVHIGARNVKPDAGADSLDEYSFKLTGDASRVYDNPSVVDPDPALNWDVYAGGEVDGWVTMQCAVGEQNLRVVYEPLFSFSGKPRYFAIQ
jgi:cell division septation protein DedD